MLMLAMAKVTKFDVWQWKGAVQQLDVPVCNAQLMAEVECDHKLLEETACQVLIQPLARQRRLVADDILKHAIARSIFRDNGQESWGQSGLPELDNAEMFSA